MIFSPLTRKIFFLASPIAIAMLGDTLLGLVDTRLVASLGPEALGGVGIGVILMWLFYMMVLGFMRGVKTCVAFAAGKGNQADAIRYAYIGMGFAFILAGILWGLSRDLTAFLNWVGIEKNLIPQAQGFLRARSWGIFATFGLAALVEYRQGNLDSKTPMFIGLAGNILNAFLAYALIYGEWGFPRLGVAGAGYSTAIAEWLEFLVMYYFFWRACQKTSSLSGSDTITWKKGCLEVLQQGVPTAISFGTEMLGFTLFTMILGGMNSVEIAAHQIALSITRLSFLPGIAVGEASSVLVSRELTQGNIVGANQIVKKGLKITFFFMTSCGAFFFLAGSFLGNLFTQDPRVVSIIGRLLIIAGIYQVFDALTIVWRSALRGAKDVLIPTFIGIGMIWLFLPTSGYLLGKKLGFGALGAWFGFLAKTSLSAVLFGWRWNSQVWLKNVRKSS